MAEVLFSQLDVDGFFLEYDDERSGGFEPLRFVPEDKLVVLGLVTTKTGELEDKDELRRRIDEASKHVPLEQLCLSPRVRLLLHGGARRRGFLCGRFTVAAAAFPALEDFTDRTSYPAVGAALLLLEGLALFGWVSNVARDERLWHLLTGIVAASGAIAAMPNLLKFVAIVRHTGLPIVAGLKEASTWYA